MVDGLHDAFVELTAVLAQPKPDDPDGERTVLGPLSPLGAAEGLKGQLQQAVAVGNDTPFGRGSYAFTTDPEQAQCVADRIEAGMVFVNLPAADEPGPPFGCVKRFGFGQELGRQGVNEFVSRKLIRIAGCTPDPPR